MHRVRIWTDGCCLQNPGGRGGWAFLIEMRGAIVHEGTGGLPSTTNNRMELAAVIEGLTYLDECAREAGAFTIGAVEVVSDSTYVVKGATQWMGTWKANGWTRRKYGTKKAREPVKNVEQWQQLDRLLARHNVKFRWVKGHANHEHNERADRLADAAAKSQQRVPA